MPQRQCRIMNTNPTDTTTTTSMATITITTATTTTARNASTSATPQSQKSAESVAATWPSSFPVRSLNRYDDPSSSRRPRPGLTALLVPVPLHRR